MPLAKIQYADLILTGIFYTWLFLDFNWILVFLLSPCIFPYASQSDSFIFHQWSYTTGFLRLASIRMNQKLQYVSNLLVLTQNYIYQCCLCCRYFLCACMPGETKHYLKIIIPAWLSMMIIIPVWRADRTEKELSEERRSSCWNCLKGGWVALGGFTSHTLTVFSEYWIMHLTRFYKDFSVLGPAGTTAMLRCLQWNLAIS